MVKFILLMFSLFGSIIVAQENPAHQSDWAIQRSTGQILTGFRREVYDSANRVWILNDTGNYSYDANSRVLVYTHFFCQGGSCNTGERTTYTYNGDGDNSVILLEHLSNGSWSNYMSDYYTFDAAHNLLTDSNQYWSTGYWRNHNKTVNTYNAAGYKTISIFANWDSMQADWIAHQKFEWYLNSNNEIDSLLSSVWINQQVGLLVNQKTYFEYNNGDITVETKTGLNQNNGFLPVYRYLNTYNQHLVIQKTGQLPDSTGGWLNDYMSQYQYDNSNNQLTDYSFAWQADSASWKPIETDSSFYNSYNNIFFYLQQRNTNNSIVSYERTFYYYQDVELGIKTLGSGKEMAIYPNPTIQFITISTDDLQLTGTLQITDITGKQVLYYNIDRSPFTFSVSDLPPGMYFARLLNNEGKLLVKRFVRE